jgi:uncharacterized protein (DUF2141 family)
MNPEQLVDRIHDSEQRRLSPMCLVFRRPAVTRWNTRIRALSAATIATLLSTAASGEEAMGELDVRVSGLKRLDGEMALAVFDSEDTYKARSDAVQKAFLPISSDPVVWKTSLPLGRTYAVIVYQDVNGNRELDMRLLGMPKEPVGVSNDARGRMGPPAFASASFVFDGNVTTIEITLQ